MLLHALTAETETIGRIVFESTFFDKFRGAVCGNQSLKHYLEVSTECEKNSSFDDMSMTHMDFSHLMKLAC